jgi:predicted metal-dependent hydrolase
LRRRWTSRRTGIRDEKSFGETPKLTRETRVLPRNQTHEINFAGKRIEFRLRRSARRTLAITVRPDLSVVVTAPQGAALDTVKAKVRKRAVWIRRQKEFFTDFLPVVPPRQYVSGETHRYLGRQYRLKIFSGAADEVKLKGRYLTVEVKGKPVTPRVKLLVDGWFLARARERFSRCMADGAARLGRRLREMPRLRLRRMAKRWGSWTRRGGIWLNPSLVKAPASCIEYVVVHELCHAVHGNHGRAFYDLLRRVMPDWEQRKARLEHIPIA